VFIGFEPMAVLLFSLIASAEPAGQNIFGEL